MEKFINVLISEDSEMFLNKAPRIFADYSISVNFAPKDGVKVIEATKTQRPDFVVTDLFMPRTDAIGVISKIKKCADVSPEFIITSSFLNQTLEREVMSAGAAYFMLKPFEICELAERIIRISALSQKKIELPDNDGNEMEIKVTDILHEIGVPAHIKGYQYLRSSIMISINNPDLINAVTKQLYPAVAKGYKTTSSRVERAMRHAIEVAWDRGNVDVLNSHFGYTIQNSRGKPTNAEFIAMISDKLRLQIKGKKMVMCR
ncbi:MAG: sporulation transcription factor Spo0A [Oscillospiraceae bacterium]|nr:sporulation transcription factor Spo0A [Oscillospiraceae bacterium]